MEISCFHSLVLLVQFFILFIPHLYSLTTDQSALLALKAHINPETQHILANNWTTATSVCNWIGITCGGQPQKVIALNLSSMGLNGTMPPQIGNLSSLTLLSLSSNNFTGALPPEIGNLSNLKALRVNNNILRGIIPSTIFNISTLQVVWLHENYLSGNLPPMLGILLPNLVELQLHDNELQGTIPSSISNASQLTVLDLSDNFFAGIIPNSIGSLRNLQRLELAYNYLTSESSTVESNFFSSLTDNGHLRRIVLSGNPLGSILPVSVGNLSTFLEYFLVTDCKLKGIIPAETGNLSSLIALELGKNGLTGIIPNTVGRLENLQGLHLQNNRLKGTILYDLCKLSSLVEIFFDIMSFLDQYQNA